MPDNNGKLTKEESDRVIRWLNTKVGEAQSSCPICGNRKWSLQSHVVAPMLYGQGAIIGGAAYPQVMLLCKNCAYTHFLNAVAIGLFPSSKGEDVNG